MTLTPVRQASTQCVYMIRVTLQMVQTNFLAMTDLEQIVTEQPAIQIIYLFGSRADGKAGPASDYDFALLLDHDADGAGIRAAFAHAIARLLVATGQELAPVAPGHVDVVWLNPIPVELAYHVIAHGRCLYKRTEAIRVEYEATVLSRYGDYLPILRQQRQQIYQQKGRTSERIQRYRAALERTQRALAEAGNIYRHGSQ